MNKTQKGAWLTVAGVLLVLASTLYITIQIGVRHKPPERVWLCIWVSAFVLVTSIGIFFFRRKQSPPEPESDERDNLIKYRAVLAAFISVWPLFLAASVIPKFIVGANGSIPVFLLPIVTVFMFYIALLVYSVAVLIQYARGAKDGA